MRPPKHVIVYFFVSYHLEILKKMDNRTTGKDNTHLANRILRLEQICEDQKLRIEELAKEIASCKQIQLIQFKLKRESGIERCRKGYSWVNHHLYSCCSTPYQENGGTNVSFDEVD